MLPVLGALLVAFIHALIAGCCWAIAVAASVEAVHYLKTLQPKNHTMKNFSQSFSKGNELGVKNMKAIFGFFD